MKQQPRPADEQGQAPLDKPARVPSRRRRGIPGSGAQSDRPRLARVSTWPELQRRVTAIVEQLTSDPKLAVAAAANPILALAEIGIQIEPDALAPIADRLRYGPQRAVRVARLRRRLTSDFGRAIDVEDDPAVRSLIVEHKLGTGDHDIEATLAAAAEWHTGSRTLRELRRLAAAAPRFATSDEYDAIRHGLVRVPISNIRPRFKNKPRVARPRASDG